MNNYVSRHEGSFDYDEAVNVSYTIQITTKSGKPIYRSSGEYDLVGLLSPTGIGRALQRFREAWVLWIADPMFAALDGHRRDLAEKARLAEPVIKYPSEIDFIKDAQHVAENLVPDVLNEEAVKALERSRKGTRRPI